MANNGYVVIERIEPIILDMPGNAAPGAQVFYTCVVLTPANNPVSISGGLGSFGIANHAVVIGVGHNDNTAAMQAALVADVRTIYNDPTINVVIL